ncbi:MAG: PEP-CTERM sorting domain-containing protein [Kiritimatiellae bacterium]|nr:PEP-CTERM sorting domain-containing protein [Kiritimatiellia bacterium]
MRTFRTVFLLAWTAGLWLAVSARAQISYTAPGLIYSENFNSLPYTPNNTTTPWTDGVTLPGWYLVNSLTNTPADIGIHRGDTTTGRFYSFGLIDDPERALGGIGSGGTYFGSPSSGSVAGYWGVRIQNNTGLTLSQFQVEYTVEQWRDANVNVQPLVAEWAIQPPNWLSGSWNSGTSTPSPVNFNAASWLNGNLASNRVTGVGFTVTGLSWTPGQELWIRFRELNDAGNDHGLAIDDFSFVAVPEPAVGSLLLATAAMWLLRRRLREEAVTSGPGGPQPPAPPA